jgi:hypothetical protein
MRETQRRKQTAATRAICRSPFGDFILGGKRSAEPPVNKVQGPDLDAFPTQLKVDGLNAQARLRTELSIRHCWNRAAKHLSPIP